MTEQLTYDEAVAKYFKAGEARALAHGFLTPPQPNSSMSYRNDKDNAWELNNVNGYLAFVPDRGGVL